jgi:hypothetical protein
MPRGDRSLNAYAGGDARQVNVAGDNFGPIYMVARHERPRVHQLPSAPPDFAGRGDLADQVREWLTAGRGPRIVNLYGIPGVGKSALGLRLAHALSAELYPDSQLYFDLREYDQGQGSSYDLLGGALVALGTPAAEVPSGIAARAAAYRSALSRQRSLIMIDNAFTAAEVEPLMPGYSESAVIITSWAAITDLPGVRTAAVPVLDDDEAVEMLRTVSGRALDPGDLAVAREIARCAGHLPLALRIAGGLLKARRLWTWSDVRQRLTAPDGSALLDKFATGKLAVAKTFDLAYGDLGTDLARAYRLLGLAPSPRISRPLARVLIDPDPAVADDLVDELAGRELLQAESRTTFRMHGLLWQRARALVADDTPALRRAARDRMTAWSLDQLDQDYTPRLRLDLNLPHEIANAVHGGALTPEIFVESPIDDPAGTPGPATLVDLFPGARRVVLIAGGGTGKTTLVNHLCLIAAQRRQREHDGPIPLIALIRDVPGSDDSDVLTLLLRTLRHRYALDMPVDALQVALAGGHVFVVLDGLDELVDRALRRAVVKSIGEFADDYPEVPLLVTSRPYQGVETGLVGFRPVTIRPWTRAISETYLADLLARVGATHAAHELLGLIYQGGLDPSIVASPLGLQMLVVFHRRNRRIPTTYTRLMELYIEDAISSREALRGTLYISVPLFRKILEAIAFAMQSNPENRVTIALPDLLRVVKQVMSEMDETRDPQSAEEIVYSLRGRGGLLRDIEWGGERGLVFGFTHTTYREHLAAEYLTHQTPEDFAAVVVRHAADASWETVFRGALEMRFRRQPTFAMHVVDCLRRKHADLAALVTEWGDGLTA